MRPKSGRGNTDPIEPVAEPSTGSISKPLYAHTVLGQIESQWELLSHHAAAVADQAAEFAGAFGAIEWGRLAGQWHDLGKASTEFQAYLRASSDADAGEEGTAPGRVDHSTFGARHSIAQMPGASGQVMAFCLAGHHAGLADASSVDDAVRSTLSRRLDPSRYAIPAVTVPPALVATVPPSPLRFPASIGAAENLGFAVAFFTRMLFSALVDADRTATEAFCDPGQAKDRARPKPTLGQMRSALDDYLDHKQRSAPPTPVNAVRAHVLHQSLAAASGSPGFFSLNVPTGGGKTFASLAFALHHAAANLTFRRVVVAIPFTSIIEQTADQYRQALGSLADDGLIEHHSSLNPKVDTRRNKMAAETWDAPLVVTTNVQLFESLFASATTPARKLHRLAHSVIILDEAQTMPIDLMAATLAALRELVARYGCTIVLCTATQPALERRPGEFDIGIDHPHPIIADAATLHAHLKRVDVHRAGALTDDALVDRLAAERQVLCVVNTKAHAAALYDALVARRGKPAGCYHLSTFMCAQHRRDVLAQVRARLKDGAACRVISTQLIEAGVDIDLPVVYRAQAGFDSIAQAAGRCNREGRLVDELGNLIYGRVIVFDTERPPPPGLLRQAADVAAELAPNHPDPLASSAVQAYFQHLYWKRSHEWDKHGVMPCFHYDPHYIAEHRKLAPFAFHTAAEAYQLIREEQTPILVPYDQEANAMVAHVIEGKPIDLAFYRKAQKYTVSVRDHFLHKLADNASLYQHEAGILALANAKGYSNKKGLLPDVAGISPEVFIV
jgi:CRISPR-associated endonuclease/helicase Cas3